MDEQHNGWAVDLTREEFIHSQMLMSRISGPLRTRTFTLIASLVLAAMMLGGAAVDWMQNGSTDWLMLAFGVLLAVMTLFMWWFIPYQVKQQAGKQYDQAKACGQNYYGFLRVYSDRIEKIGDTASASIALDRTAFFVEEAQTMILTGRSRWALVLPARCLTEEMAAAVRQAVDRLPVQNRRFISRLRPQGQPVTEPPTEQVDALWETALRYTPEEYGTVARAMTVQHYWRLAPWMVTVSILGGLAFGWDGRNIWPCALWFLVCYGVMTLLNLVMPLSRIKRQVAVMDSTALTMQVKIDSRGVHITDPRMGRVGFPWSQVRHVYDKGEFVEICEKHRFFRIPKRCIEDLEAFDAMITRCREQQNV